MNARSKLQRGFTLVELMIVVAIVGVLAALAIYGVRKYIAHAKTAEVRNSLGQMGKDSQSAFARESMSGAVLATGGTAEASSRLCTTASATVPASATDIQGKKYQSAPENWTVDVTAAGSTTPSGGFACLRFSMTDPQYFLYNYVNTGTTGQDGDKFDAIGQGDLNGDTVLSSFTLSGTLQKGTKGMELNVAPNFVEVDPEE